MSKFLACEMEYTTRHVYGAERVRWHECYAPPPKLPQNTLTVPQMAPQNGNSLVAAEIGNELVGLQTSRQKIGTGVVQFVY